MKKLGKFINNNIVGFILGAIIFGGSAAVIAGTVASNEITYTNNGQTNVQGALNDLYGKADILGKYQDYYGLYWNDDYKGGDYGVHKLPSKIYVNYKELITSDIDLPFMKITYNNGIADSQSACLYIATYDKYFCIEYDFWGKIAEVSPDPGFDVTYSLNDLINVSLGINNIDCIATSNRRGVVCQIGTSACSVFEGNTVDCGTNISNIHWDAGYFDFNSNSKECFINNDDYKGAGWCEEIV